MRFRCRSRRCPSCGLLWAGDTRRKLLANISAYGGDVALVTVTAPGSARFPTRREMVEWNLSAPARWRRLSDRSRSWCTRRGLRVHIVSRTYEYQQRGALHIHVVVGMATARERAGAHQYALQLDTRRHGLDFGFVSDSGRSGKWRTRGLQVIVAERAARYVAKYLSPLDQSGKPTLSETVTRRDVPPHVVYVSRRLTAKTGVTMRSLRRRRQAHMLGVNPDTGELYTSIARNEILDGGGDVIDRIRALIGVVPNF